MRTRSLVSATRPQVNGLGVAQTVEKGTVQGLVVHRVHKLLFELGGLRPVAPDARSRCHEELPLGLDSVVRSRFVDPPESLLDGVASARDPGCPVGLVGDHEAGPRHGTVAPVAVDLGVSYTFKRVIGREDNGQSPALDGPCRPARDLRGDSSLIG